MHQEPVVNLELSVQQEQVGQQGPVVPQVQLAWLEQLEVLDCRDHLDLLGRPVPLVLQAKLVRPTLC